MIAMAGRFKSYGVLTRPGKPTGKARTERHTIDTIRYNGYSTSGRRSSSRHLCGQFNQSRGRLMQASPRIVKKHCRVTIARVPLVACPPAIACVRWALPGQLPIFDSEAQTRRVAPRGASSTRARVLAHATRPPARYWLLCLLRVAADKISSRFQAERVSCM